MTILAWTMFTAAALAAPGQDVVLVLDNSCSMVVPSQVEDQMGRKSTLPANDPERAAVLGALLVEGWSRASNDAFSVIAFGSGEHAPAQVVHNADEIRGLPYVGGTWFRPALTTAVGLIGSATREHRQLWIFTDGAPTDIDTPSDGKALVSAAGAPLYAVGLYADPSAADLGRAYLSALVSSPEDLALVDASVPDAVSRVVHAFTTLYARSLGSRPESGALNVSEKRTFQVGRYVTEVLVSVASQRPGDPFDSVLTGPMGAVLPKASGDNGCPPSVALANAPDICSPPRRHYQTYRAPNDPDAASTWTLELARGSGPVEYGVVLRYDLVAELEVPSTARVAETVPLKARILFHGKTFDDEAFFGADGFRAVVEVEGAEIPLRKEPGGTFIADWVPSLNGTARPRVHFSSNWLDLSADQATEVEGFYDLVLRPTPSPVELGTWDGERGDTRHCVTLDLTGSTNTDRVPLTCEVHGESEGARLECGPVAGSEASLPGGLVGQPQRWQACVVSNACCSTLPGTSDKPFELVLRGTHSHYDGSAVTVPVHYAVRSTGFLRCWWVEIAIAFAGLSSLWFFWGWISPRSFEPSLQIKIASRESGLARAPALSLGEQPGGRRGFYRHARLSIDAEGTPVRQMKRAVLVIEAAPGGTARFLRAPGLERFDRRTRKMVSVDPSAADSGPDIGVAYRVGSLYFVLS